MIDLKIVFLLIGAATFLAAPLMVYYIAVKYEDRFYEE